MLYYLCLNTQLKALFTFLSLFLKQYVSVYLSWLLLTLCSQTHWQLLLGSKQHVFRWGSVKFPSTGLQRCYCCICMLLYLVKLLKICKYLMNACRSKTMQKLHSQKCECIYFITMCTSAMLLMLKWQNVKSTIFTNKTLKKIPLFPEWSHNPRLLVWQPLQSPNTI